MLLQYCCGNTAVLHELSFSEAVEIIKNAINDRNDELLYKAYILTVVGNFTGLLYTDFVNKVTGSTRPENIVDTVNTEEIEKKVENYLDNYKWEEV
ncbi:MAG: hypothetical protein ACLUJF_08345 [Ruminococcus sp.]